MVDLWLLGRRYSGPMTPAPLPAPGATGEQPAALMDAFEILNGLGSNDD